MITTKSKLPETLPTKKQLLKLSYEISALRSKHSNSYDGAEYLFPDHYEDGVNMWISTVHKSIVAQRFSRSQISKFIDGVTKRDLPTIKRISDIYKNYIKQYAN